MATGAAIFSVGTSLIGARKQRKAGKQAQAGAEEGALAIEAETEMNIEQTRRSQAQMLGLAKANIAASGIRFDAAKIGEVAFSEGAEQAAKKAGKAMTSLGLSWKGGKVAGIAGLARSIQTMAMEGERAKTLKPEGGIQVAGETEGGSTFTYLKEMKRSFAENIAWQSKEGRSRAKVMRMGGQVAKAQAYAGAMQSYGQAAGSFATAGTSAGWWK